MDRKMTQKRRTSLTANLEKMRKLEEEIERGRKEIAPKVGMPFVEKFNDTFTVRNAKELAAAVHRVGVEEALQALRRLNAIEGKSGS